MNVCKMCLRMQKNLKSFCLFVFFGGHLLLLKCKIYSQYIEKFWQFDSMCAEFVITSNNLNI